MTTGAIAAVGVAALVFPGANAPAGCGGGGGGGEAAPVVATGATDAPDSAHAADAPIVAIGDRYELRTARTLDRMSRHDDSGVLALGNGQVWLVDDKPRDLDSVIVATTAAGNGEFRPIRVLNPLGRPVGDDVEDLAALPSAGQFPRLLAIVGERGPRERPVSWFALGLVDTAAGGSITLVETREASPPGETVGNDGLEGVALLALGGDTVAVMTFKERTPPIYVRSYLYRWAPDASEASEPRPLTPIGEPLMDHVPGVVTQASAAFAPDGDLYVLDRYTRRIAVVPRAAVVAALRDPADDALAPREWIDFTPLVPALEGRSGAPGVDAPLSIFGTAEGLAFGADGTLYLLSDNNESGPSVLLTLTPKR